MSIRLFNSVHIWTSSPQTRLEVELTARRCLAYLSGGQSLTLLEDILYPNEKEQFSLRYRAALVRVGEAVRHVHPR